MVMLSDRKLQVQRPRLPPREKRKMGALATALLDQIDHWQQQLAVPGEKLGQLLFIGPSLLVDRVVAFLHGGFFLSRFGDPILY
jgi:hypothetical protein